MNRNQLMGRLTRDPETKYTQTGKCVTSFSLAVKRSGNTEVVDYIDIVAWGALAESCGNELRKGEMVIVDGRLQTRSYETQDGQKRKVTEVIAGYISKPLDAWERKDKAVSSVSSTEILPDSNIPF